MADIESITELMTVKQETICNNTSQSCTGSCTDLQEKEGLLKGIRKYESPLYESSPVSVVDAIESRDFGTSVTT